MLWSEYFSKHKVFYEKDWHCCLHTVVCEYQEVYDSRNFWSTYHFIDSVDRVIFDTKESLDYYHLDHWEPLHNLNLPYIEIRNKNHFSKNIIKDYFYGLWVYLNTKQFTLKTKKGNYLVEPISSNIAIIGDNNWKIHNKKSDWFIFKAHFIDGEHFKVKLNFDSFEDEEILTTFMADHTWLAIVKLSDIYKIELNELHSIQYFSEFSNLTEIELTINESQWDKETIMNRLSKTPRNLNVIIYIELYSAWICYDSEFWKIIAKHFSTNLYWLFFKDLPKNELQILRRDIFKKILMLSFEDSMSALELSKHLARIISKTRIK